MTGSTARGHFSEDVPDKTFLLASIVESSDDAIIAKTSKGIISSWNTGAEKIYGFSAREAIGRPITILIPPGQTDEVPALLERIERGESIHHYETVRRRKDGQLIHVSQSISPIKDRDGQIIGVSTIARDVTAEVLARKQAEEKLAAASQYARSLIESSLDAEVERIKAERATTLLESVSKELEAFSYAVSHDLRAPLRAISGFTEALLEDWAPRLDDEGKRYLGLVQKNAHKMGQLIDDLLAFTQLGRQTMTVTEIDMAELAQTVSDELLTQSPGRCIVFTIGTIPPAHGDKALIRQALANLLANAIKFTRTREKAIIEVGGRPAGDWDDYFVRDNGVGFEMQYVGKLFGIFQRLHSVTEFEGTGVGLALVSRIITRHGGTVRAEGDVDRGATFYFSLPNRGRIESHRHG